MRVRITSTFRRHAVLTVALLFALAPAVARAQQPLPSPEVGSAVGSYGAWDWLGLGMRLALVVAVIWGAVWAMRWYVRRVGGAGGGSGRLLQVVETRALGPNRSLQLVRLGGRAVLLGVTPERINALLELDDPEEVRRLAETAEGQRSRRSLDTLVGGLAGGVNEAIVRLRAARDARAGGPGVAAPGARLPAVASMPAATGAASAQRLQAMSGYRRAKIAELQRAIEQARAGTSAELRR